MPPFAVLAAAFLLSDAPGRWRIFWKTDSAWKAVWPFQSGHYLVNRTRAGLLNAGLLQRDMLVTSRDGVTMKVDVIDAIGHLLIRDGVWEAQSSAATLEHMPEGGVILDVGAHHGYYSLLAMRKAGPSGMAIAFEPNPNTAARMRENIGLNNASNIRLFEIACTAEEQTLELFEGPDWNVGRSSLASDNAKSGGKLGRKYSVRGRPLDDVVAEVSPQRIDLLKVDVEGAEMTVLKGAAKTLDKYHPYVMIEVDARWLKSFGTTPEMLDAFLAEHGYGPGTVIDGTNKGYAPRR